MKLNLNLKGLLGIIIAASPLLSIAQYSSMPVAGIAPGISWVMNGKKAYMVLPPIAIATGEIANISWSPNGRYLLVESSTEPVLPSANSGDLDEMVQNPASLSSRLDHLYLWDAKTLQSTRIWTASNNANAVSNIQWFHSGKAALIQFQSIVTDNRGNPTAQISKIELFLPATKKFKTITSQSFFQKNRLVLAYSQITIKVAPNVDQAIVTNTVSSFPRATAGMIQSQTMSQQPKMSVHSALIDGNGNIVRSLPSVPNVNLEYCWSQNGASIYGKGIQFQRNRRPSTIYYYFGSNGKVDKLPQKPDIYVPTVSQPKGLFLSTKLIPVKVGNRFESELQTLLVGRDKSIEQSCLLGGIIDNPQVSNDLKAVSYETNGTVFIRRIIPIPPDVLVALIAAEKAKAISDAKQVALGIIMYSADHNDNMPGSGNWQNGVNPYVNNDALVMNFTYTPPGQLNETEIPDPATTVMGYVQGPGGEAVAYTDGHVHWQPNP